MHVQHTKLWFRFFFFFPVHKNYRRYALVRLVKSCYYSTMTVNCFRYDFLCVQKKYIFNMKTRREQSENEQKRSLFARTEQGKKELRVMN